MTLRLLLATANRVKAERLRALCKGTGVSCRDGRDLAGPLEDETGTTHTENAERKAVAWSRLHECAAMGSDGGLVIPALGGEWSSLETKRATGGDVDDAAHAEALLRQMRGLADDRRRAYWVEAVAIATGGRIVGSWEASGLAGRIAEDYRPRPDSTGGFWVSGLWVTPAGRRYWEMTDAELAGLGDPWAVLKPRVQAALREMAAHAG